MTRALPLIAVVDDEEAVRKALMRLLRSAQFDVVQFATGAEFLDSVLKHIPDCVILDLQMPLMSGHEVQAKLFQTGIHVPVIIITGQNPDEAQWHKMDSYASAYLIKPIDSQTLLDAIRNALSPNPHTN